MADPQFVRIVAGEVERLMDRGRLRGTTKSCIELLVSLGLTVSDPADRAVLLEEATRFVRTRLWQLPLSSPGRLLRRRSS